MPCLLRWINEASMGGQPQAAQAEVVLGPGIQLGQPTQAMDDISALAMRMDIDGPTQRRWATEATHWWPGEAGPHWRRQLGTDTEAGSPQRGRAPGDGHRTWRLWQLLRQDVPQHPHSSAPYATTTPVRQAASSSPKTDNLHPLQQAPGIFEQRVGQHLPISELTCLGIVSNSGKSAPCGNWRRENLRTLNVVPCIIE